MKTREFSFAKPALALTLAATLLAGCSSMSERERGTAKGAAVGGAAGAVIGAATGGNAGRGAVLGGAVGAIAGNLWTKRMEDKREALARASVGTGIDVQRTDDNRLRVNVPTVAPRAPLTRFLAASITSPSTALAVGMPPAPRP